MTPMTEGTPSNKFQKDEFIFCSRSNRNLGILSISFDFSAKELSIPLDQRIQLSPEFCMLPLQLRLNFSLYINHAIDCLQFSVSPLFVIS